MSEKKTKEITYDVVGLDSLREIFARARQEGIDDLVLEGLLDLSDSPVTDADFPEDITVHILGNADFRRTKELETVPGLNIGGYLDITETGATNVNKGLAVGGSIYRQFTSISREKWPKELLQKVAPLYAPEEEEASARREAAYNQPVPALQT